MARKYCPQCQQTYANSERLCPNDQSVLSLQDPYHLVGRTLLDKYRIEALVGLGGMGAVYCAYHMGIDRRVAFKILQPNIAVGDEHIAELFEREAKVAGRLTHENIVDVKDAGRSSDGLAYIVMEWLEGRTLEEELKMTGRFGFARTAEILRQIAAALAEAHSKHIIHRDLKPANVMLVKRGDGSEQVKVLDFGIGKVIGETGGSVSAVIGTPSYASPEQLQLGRQIDARSDIYSLGVILYRMLIGRLPFKGASPNELIQLQLTATPSLLGALRPETPVAIERLVSRMLAKDPADRPQSAREVTTNFDRALAEIGQFEAHKMTEDAHSGETTFVGRQDLGEQTTEEMPTAAPPDQPHQKAVDYAGAVTTNPFTHVAAAAKPASRVRPGLISGVLIGLAVIAAGYGLYRYAFNAGLRADNQGVKQAPESNPAQSPAAAPTQETVAPAQVRESPSPSSQAPSAAARRMADQHFSQAQELYSKGDYRAALNKCNEALRLDPQHRGALNLRRKVREVIKILGER